ncbi:hypothetical protein B0H10DRAFT_1366883 [Mycena sp. CBHHK59/15]|nr:hypothetical protein B0H10DRAFT_1366883 [Mycena sp. CBHHK59/15]
MQHSRNYSYSPSGYSGNSSSPPDVNAYPGQSPPYEQSSGGRPYYAAPTSNVRMGQQSNQYYAPIAPVPPVSGRYSGSYRSSGFFASQDNTSPPSYPSQYNAASESRGYQSNHPPTSSYSYNAPVPRPASPMRNDPAPYHRHPSNQPPPGQFIPTPSETYANRPPRPSSAMHSNRHSGPYSTAPHPITSSSRGSHHASSRPRTSMSTSPTSVSSPPGERFICEVCRKDFSRAHDRKRHHETQHAPTPVMHKCVYCDKDFSRADSLKRHLQNGCDDAPQ